MQMAGEAMAQFDGISADDIRSTGLAAGMEAWKAAGLPTDQ
jgi:hypothetical protein